MLPYFLSDFSAGQLLIRMAATAFVVIGVAMAVARFGPLIGGALAGLPIVLGPGFYFLIAQAGPQFVAEAAAYSVLSLCATQLFLLAYIALAQRARPSLALLAAVGAWLAGAALFRFLPPQPLIGMGLFIVLTIAVRRLGAAFVGRTTRPARRENLTLLLLRGLLAGVLVALVTAGAGRLGAAGSGLLLAFPIGYAVLSVTIHEQFGAAAAAATLYSAILGTLSLAGFCATLAFAAPNLAPLWAFGAALAVSLLITFSLVMRSRMRPAGR